MPTVFEQELVCSVCEKTRGLPECCGKSMEFDKEVFFCPACGRELKVPVCCQSPMKIHNRLRDIEKEIFG